MADSGKGKQRSKEDIRSDIDESRSRLVENLAELKAQLQPAALAERVKVRAQTVFVDPETGSVRTERVVAVSVTVVTLIVVRKGLKSRARRKEMERLRKVVWVPVPQAAVSAEYAPLARQAKELGPNAIFEVVGSGADAKIELVESAA